MFKRVFASLVLVFSVFSAQAGIITISDYWLQWDINTGANTEAGGNAIIYYRESNNALRFFGVNVAPFAESVNDANHVTNDWLTQVAGSGYTFDPVELTSVWAEDNILFTTSMGLGVATWNGGKLQKINFPDGMASWNIMKVDIPLASSVPEPGSLALLSFGLLSIAIRQRVRKT